MVKCQHSTCSGTIDFATPYIIEVNFFSPRRTFACLTCGRLHWPNGRALFCPTRRQGVSASSSLTPMRVEDFVGIIG